MIRFIDLPHGIYRGKAVKIKCGKNGKKIYRGQVYPQLFTFGFVVTQVWCILQYITVSSPSVVYCKIRTTTLAE